MVKDRRFLTLSNIVISLTVASCSSYSATNNIVLSDAGAPVGGSAGTGGTRTAPGMTSVVGGASTGGSSNSDSNANDAGSITGIGGSSNIAGGQATGGTLGLGGSQPTGGVAGTITGAKAITGGATTLGGSSSSGGVGGIPSSSLTGGLPGVGGASTTTGGTPSTGGTSTAPSGCIINGGFKLAGAVDPSNSCQSCQPNVITTMWAPVPDGNSCANGVCVSGACSNGCWIKSGFVANGTANPDNPCQSCQANTSVQAWSNVTAPGAFCVQDVETSEHHSCALANGSVYCWGQYNDAGELGLGSTATSLVPKRVNTLRSDTSAIELGSSHTCALNSGTVWCWGNNTSGQLGVGSTVNSNVPVQVSKLNEGSVSAISARSNQTCAISTGLVHCWGSNANGELGPTATTDSTSPVGLGTPADDVTVGTGYFCIIRNSAGSCRGGNNSGQLGDGSTLPRTTFVQITDFSSGVTEISGGSYLGNGGVANGAAYVWGSTIDYRSNTAPQPVASLTSGVTALSVGTRHVCAIHNGGAYCWGQNASGQLGNGSTAESATPVPVTGLTSGVTRISAGSTSTCAVANGNGYCWGTNLGNGTSGASNSPVLLSGF